MSGGRGQVIFLYGPPGAGKTTVGKCLAAELELPFIDLDGEISKSQGMTIPEIFETGGEAHFRSLESTELKRAAGSEPDAVVALGGGALLDPANRRLAEEKGQVIFLSLPDEVLLTRVKRKKDSRPLLSSDPAGQLKILLGERRGHYSSFQHRIEIKGLTPAQIAREIQLKLGRFHLPDPAGKTNGYDVLVRAGLLDEIGAEIVRRELRGPVMIVSDENVAHNYLAQVEKSLGRSGLAYSSYVIPVGEEHKNLQQAANLWEAFLSAGLERGSTVLALGGGVVSDLAGFAASTYLRGLRWVVAPTTLLAMVDAGLGGKTGIDLPQGKNLAGTFHSPSLVISDPQALGSLPPPEFLSGLAETFKAGLIDDPRLYRMCLDLTEGFPRDLALLEEIIKRAVAVKVRVIRQDPYEGGRRAVLNLGHTIGHAVELVSGFSLRHGEAVAIGLAAETRLAEDMELTEPGFYANLRADLTKMGLPVEIPAGLDPEEIMRALKRDKKRANGKVKFALAKKVGEAVVGIEIDEGRIADAIHTHFARA